MIMVALLLMWAYKRGDGMDKYEQENFSFSDKGFYKLLLDNWSTTTLLQKVSPLYKLQTLFM